MKRPNTERMQKHAARGIPDTMRRRFKVGDDMQDEIVAFHEWFKRKMRIKHPGVPAVTDGKMTDEGQIDEIFVTMSWRPIRKVDLGYMRPNDVRLMMGYTKVDVDLVADLYGKGLRTPDFGQYK